MPTSTFEDKRRPEAGARSLRAELHRDAELLGFCGIGIASVADATEAADRLKTFLAAERHGDMAWLARDPERRAQPSLLWPEAKSIVMLAMSYTPASDPLPALEQRSSGVISVYAQGRDYHDVMKPKLKALARRLQGLAGGDVKVFVDTAPVMEKPLAAAGCGPCAARLP